MKEFALGFATHAHIRQKRKYTGQPYVVHCIAVAKRLEEFGFNEHVICAALLHDTVEDTDTTNDEIREIFGLEIAKLVEELTDVYVSKDFPNLNRKESKKLECDRISHISSAAKSIKLADLIDNTISFVEHDKSFARIFVREKEALLEVLKEGDDRLYAKAYEVMINSKKVLYGE